MKIRDRSLGLACLRAFNDWHLEAWSAPFPGRIIPNQVTWLLDPEVAAAEIRRNAGRGFRALSFSENPENDRPKPSPGATPDLGGCDLRIEEPCHLIGNDAAGNGADHASRCQSLNARKQASPSDRSRIFMNIMPANPNGADTKVKEASTPTTSVCLTRSRMHRRRDEARRS